MPTLISPRSLCRLLLALSLSPLPVASFRPDFSPAYLDYSSTQFSLLALHGSAQNESHAVSTSMSKLAIDLVAGAGGKEYDNIDVKDQLEGTFLFDGGKKLYFKFDRDCNMEVKETTHLGSREGKLVVVNSSAGRINVKYSGETTNYVLKDDHLEIVGGSSPTSVSHSHERKPRQDAAYANFSRKPSCSNWVPPCGKFKGISGGGTCCENCEVKESSAWCFAHKDVVDLDVRYIVPSVYGGRNVLFCERPNYHYVGSKDGRFICAGDQERAVKIDGEDTRISVACCGQGLLATCLWSASFAEGQKYCKSIGKSVCTVNELRQLDGGWRTGCPVSTLSWTFTPCVSKEAKLVFLPYVMFMVRLVGVDFTQLKVSSDRLDVVLHDVSYILERKIRIKGGKGLNLIHAYHTIDGAIEIDIDVPLLYTPEEIRDDINRDLNTDDEGGLRGRIKDGFQELRKLDSEVRASIMSGFQVEVVRNASVVSSLDQETYLSSRIYTPPAWSVWSLHGKVLCCFCVLPTLMLVITSMLILSSHTKVQTTDFQKSSSLTETGGTGPDVSSCPTDDSDVICNNYLTMHFNDPKLESPYRASSWRSSVRLGCLCMALLWLTFMFSTCWNDWRASCDVDVMIVKTRIAVEGAMACICIISSMFVGYDCVGSRICYFTLLAALFAYTTLEVIPPLGSTCLETLELSRTCDAAQMSLTRDMLEAECSSQSHNSQIISMCLVLLFPRVLPFYGIIHVAWPWVLIGYPMYLWWSVDEYFQGKHNRDQIMKASLLQAVALALATVSHYTAEKAERAGFLSDLQEKKASAKLFKLLQFMVPKSCVTRMIQSPNEAIADPVPRCAILFVIITDFDDVVHKKSAKEVLDFLNEIFSRLDSICKIHGVTKVETVGEEYVACVGTEPQDLEDFHQGKFPEVVRRLFNAAEEMLGMQESFAPLQNSGCKLQMGVHSGAVVAGVIGHKLPRFRLFGDTINTSARMMQQGVKGRLQFGEETKADLPPDIDAEFRGTVAMKGKGEVNAWLFKPRNEEDLKKHSRERAVTASSIGIMDIICGDEDGENDFETIDDLEFERMLESMVTNDVDTKRFGLSMVKLAPEVDKEWQDWFYRKEFCAKLGPRLETLMLIITVLTFVESVSFIIYNIPTFESFSVARYGGVWRIPLYLATRGAIFSVLLLWRLISIDFDQLKCSPAVIQAAVIGSLSGCIFLMFVSYDAITVMDDITEDIVKPNKEVFKSGQDFFKTDADWWYLLLSNQMFARIFVLVYFIFSNYIPTKFYLSGIYVATAFSISLLAEEVGMPLYFHGQAAIVFTCFGFLSSLVFFEVERNSKSRFHSKYMVNVTNSRAKAILNSLMPKQVVVEIRANPTVSPFHEYVAATILQADLCGFTQLSAKRKPHEVVAMVSDLFGSFDDLCDRFGCYKVETIGDAYICGMAEHTLTATNSPATVIKLGLSIIQATLEWAVRINEICTCRVGVHHGNCIGGVVGKGMQRYHLFGNLMSYIEILESTSMEGKVQISLACKGAAEHDHGPTGRAIAGLGLTFTQREGDKLVTSKGLVHEFSEVGGSTFFATLTDVTGQ